MDLNTRKRRTSSALPESDKFDKNRGKTQLRHSNSFINKDTSDRMANDVLFQNLVKDPEKRALLLQMLSQEKETIFNNKKYLQDGNFESSGTPKKTKNKLRIESPSALWKRRAMEKQQASESGSVSSDQLPPNCATPTVPFEKLLKGVVGFVELKCKGEDKSSGAKKLMIAMGAEVRDTFTKDVTHVVFKDGSFNTYYKAKLLKIHLVSVLWLDAIKTTGIRVPEKKFPALGFSSRENHDLSKICLDFQNDYEEMIQDEFQKTLALSTEILSQSFNSDHITKRRRTSNKKNADISLSSEDNSIDPDPIDLNSVPQLDKQSSTQNWLQNVTNSSHSDQLDDSFSDVESDCGMVDGCSAKKSKELEILNKSISNSVFEIDKLIETASLAKDTFNKSEFSRLLREDKEVKDQRSYSRGTHSTSTSDSKSLLTGRNLRRSTRISTFDRSKSSGASEELTSLELSSDAEQKRKSNSINLKIEERTSEVKNNRITNASSTMSSLRISSSTARSSNKRESQLQRTNKESNGSKNKLDQIANKKSTELNEEPKDVSHIKTRSSLLLNRDVNLKSTKIVNVPTNLLEKTKTQPNNLENTTNKSVYETESSGDSKTATQTKKKRRKLFNPDEFLLEENEDIQHKQPIVLINSTVLVENTNKDRANTTGQQKDKKSTNKPQRKSNKKCQENISPTRRDLDSSESEADSSPKKQPNDADKKIIRDLARRRSVRIQTKKFTQKEIVATPDPKRRSSYDFVPKGKTLSQRKVKKTKISSIVCTRLHRPDVQTFMRIVKKLGTFYTEDEVSERTTHLVAGEPRRTINMLRALARGCWILNIEWLYKSLEVGRWIEEEDYELTEFSPAVQQCRKQRQAFGSLYSMDIFENMGPIFVSNSSVPRRSDLEELIVLCKGTITRTASVASVIVGKVEKGAVCVSEKWILDSVMYNKKKSFKNYLLKLTSRISKEF